MNPYLHLGVFVELRNRVMFNTVRVSFDTIEWENGADFDPEILYAESTSFESLLASESTTEYKADKILLSIDLKSKMLCTTAVQPVVLQSVFCFMAGCCEQVIYF